MVAAVIEMSTLTIEVDRLPAERRRELLAYLARHLEMPDELISICLQSLARHHPDLDYRFTDFCERLRLADDARDGLIDYREVDDELLCTERMEAAREIAFQDAQAALDVLAGSAR